MVLFHDAVAIVDQSPALAARSFRRRIRILNLCQAVPITAQRGSPPCGIEACMVTVANPAALI